MFTAVLGTRQSQPGNVVLAYPPSFIGYGSGTLKAIIVSGESGTVSDIGSAAGTLKAIIGHAIGRFGSGSGTFKAIRVTRQLTVGISETLSLGEAFTESKVKPHIASDSLVLTETLSYQRLIINHISEHLSFTEAATSGGNIFERNISEQLHLKGGAVRALRFTNETVAIPELMYTLVSAKRPCVALSCQATNTSISLPCPEFGDTESAEQKVIIKRTMNNILKTYTRKNDLCKLTYAFTVGRGLAANLKAFIDANISNSLDLINWKGEIWKVRLTDNPIDMIARSLFENEGEKYEVRLTMEGIQLL